MFKFLKAAEGKNNLIPIIAIVVSVVIFISLLTAVFSANKKALTLKLDLKKVQEELSEKEAVLTTEIKSLKTSKADLETKTFDLETAKKAIETKLLEAEGLNVSLRGQLETVKLEKAELYKKSMEEIRKTEMSLLSKLDELKDENLDLQNKLFKLTVLTSGNTYVAEKAPRPGSVEFKPKEVIVKSRDENLLEGKIIRIDQTYGFIIFDLGQGSALAPGVVGYVYRGKLKISEIAVKEVYANMSFALVIKEKSIRPVKRGDRVVFNLANF